MSLFGKGTLNINGIEFYPISNLTENEFYKYYNAMDFELKNLWQMNYTYIMVSENQQKKHYYKIIDKTLCIFQKYNKGLALLFIPIGHYTNVADILFQCFDIMKKCSCDGYQIRIDWVNEKQLNYIGKENVKFQKMIDHKTQCIDYLYDPYMVVNMEGSEYRYIRRKINKFKNKYPNAYIREYCDEDYNNMMLLASEWKHYVKDEIGRYEWLVDANYYKNTLLHYKDLNHKVYVCVNDDKIIGMVSGGEIIPDEYAWCFNRKPLNQYDGLSELLVWHICDVFKNCSYLNDGSGSSGLSFFKERFRPIEQNKLYIINGIKGA